MYAIRSYYDFAVAALSRNYIESSLSDILEIEIIPPEKTILYFPGDGMDDQPEQISFSWRNAKRSSFSAIEIARDSMRNNFV